MDSSIFAKYQSVSHLISLEQMMYKLKNIKLVSLDVDGTLTDGSMYVFNHQHLEGIGDIKGFNAQDGMGIASITKIGIRVVFISTGTSKLIQERAKIFNLEDVYLNCTNKAQALSQICNKYNIDYGDAIHMGDDINDISAFQLVGLPIAVANATMGVLPYVKYQTKKAGGYGAVREITDYLLLAQTGSLYVPPYDNQLQ